MAEDYYKHSDFIFKNDCKTGFSGHMNFERVIICIEEDIERNSFGNYKLSNELQWLYGPCASRCQFNNCVMIFDTEKFEIEAIPLLFA